MEEGEDREREPKGEERKGGKEEEIQRNRRGEVNTCC